MPGWMIFLTILATYLFGVMVSARVIHKRRYVEWMRWRNEDPNRFEDFGYGAHRANGVRKDFPLTKYIEHVSKGMPRGVSWFWPFLGPGIAIKHFCFPTNVKIPDRARIDELENLK